MRKPLVRHMPAERETENFSSVFFLEFFRRGFIRSRRFQAQRIHAVGNNDTFIAERGKKFAAVYVIGTGGNDLYRTAQQTFRLSGEKQF